MATNLNSKSLKYLRDHGYIAQVVETIIPKTFFKRDLFGCFDVLAVGHGHVKFVQVTSRSNASTRRKKVLGSEAFPELALCPALVELHLWYKQGRFWRVKVETL